MNKYTIITLYLDALKPYCESAILGRAQKSSLIKIDFCNLRDFGLGKYKQVDDTPYGGGPGMILRADVVIPAIKKVKGKTRAKVIILAPTGRQFDQKCARKLSKEDNLIFICGRFEGFDERIKKYADDVISVGPYVLAGGELPALTIIEATARLIPGVLGNPESPSDESHSDQTLEYPQYTKPEVFEKYKVPTILLSGHHGAIKKWRQDHRIQV